MAGVTWTKFFWSDWQSDPALRLCSYAARGLWMDMLCIAAAHDPIGYVAVAGRALNETAIARMTGGQESEVRALLGELDQNGVFSRDRHGRIYSRRMIADAKKAAIARKNGKNGGNPSLRKDDTISASDNHEDNTPLKPHKPEASNQIRDKDADASSVGKPDEARIAFDEWNALAERLGLPKARNLDKGRRASLKARLTEGGLPTWREALAAVERSPHCRGENDRGWKADIDFVCQPKSWRRLLEGFYGGSKGETATATIAFTGPADVIAAVVKTAGVQEAAILLNRCTWQDLPDRALLSTNGVVVDTLRRTAGPALEGLGVKVLLAGKDAA